jgi:GNAT superfamily N-acetyltransferase
MKNLGTSAASKLLFRVAVAEDALELAALHTAVADNLTNLHGRGPWSSRASEKGALRAIRHSRVVVATERSAIIATFCLTTKKPWAIDTSYFTECALPLYLLGMAVTPSRQRQGVGRKCLGEAQHMAAAWPADAIRLDAYDAGAGGGPFYERCGFTERGHICYRKAPLTYYEMLIKINSASTGGRSARR